MLFDSHAHLNDARFDEDREALIKKLQEEHVDLVLNPGADIETSISSVELANKYDFIYAAVGVHPHDVKDLDDTAIDTLRKLAIENEKVVAIGEIGLDYYWNTDNKELQKKAFIEQIKIANKYNLPIVIHTREAVMDTLQILKENKVTKTGVFHCCPQNRELIKEGLKLGFYISFAGPITFKNSKNAVEMINLVPNDRILIETDSPYLSPEPHRGQRNDCRNVKYVAQKIADAKGMTLEQIADITYENARKIFKI